MSDIDIIKKIILKLYAVENDNVIRNELYFFDDELKDLLKELKEK